ncbi:MAG: hypothetical protein EPN94_11000 [Nitrospirae bacterium]|nr:MAG: hypothetical protein EPN94_11000 [Nitrospirota bacterium]
MWTRAIEIAEENFSKVKSGFELIELIRQEFAGEEMRVPSKLPVTYIVPIVHRELKNSNYEAIAEKYNLSVKTVRRYESWTLEGGKLISPDGKTYFLNEAPI